MVLAGMETRNYFAQDYVHLIAISDHDIFMLFIYIFCAHLFVCIFMQVHI